MPPKNKQISLACGCCRGTGRVPFTGVNADTLGLLKRQNDPVSGADLARQDGCTNEAMCNRLRVLERHGLATSTRYGRERLWTAKE